MKRFFLIFLLVISLTVTIVAFAEAVESAPPTFKIDLTQLILAIITLIDGLLVSKIIPWIKAATSERHQRLIRAAITTAVYAAEQLYGAGKGGEKLRYVKKQIAKKGYDVDVDQIEAAVKELNIAQSYGK